MGVHCVLYFYGLFSTVVFHYRIKFFYSIVKISVGYLTRLSQSKIFDFI